MKRPTRGGLSEEDRQVWEAVAKSIKPLRKAARLTTISADRTMQADSQTKPAQRHKPLPTTKSSPPPKPPTPPLAPIARTERTKIARGRKEIQARIDLHGMTQARAHHALQNFLLRAHHDGLSLVLVITGKGKAGAESERGVLRRQVPLWLSLPEFRHLVIGFDEAHIGHGGAGALYVRIRRVR